MKNKLNILILAAVALATINMASCTKDDLGPSIFDTKEYPLDRNLYTFPLDTFVKVNFLEPYNMKFLYRMQYISSDKDKNLTPASYENSCCCSNKRHNHLLHFLFLVYFVYNI